jgi:hypothetical protein
MIMKKKLLTADQLLQQIKQDKLALQQNILEYQQQIKAQLVSPLSLGCAVALGFVLSGYVFPKKEGATPAASAAETPSILLNLAVNLLMTLIPNLVSELILQKKD